MDLECVCPCHDDEWDFPCTMCFVDPNCCDGEIDLDAAHAESEISTKD